VSLRVIIGQYLEEYEAIRPLGKTKRQTLSSIAVSWLGDLADDEVTCQRLVEYAQWRLSPEGGGVQPQTLGNDLSHLGAVLTVARPAWGYDLDQHAVPDARKVLRKLNMVSRSKERDRRPTLEELDKVFQQFVKVQARRPSATSMLKVSAFAIFSTRRQEEICRIRWDDLDREGRRILVRNMKHPGDKIGNDVWCHLPDEALAIIESMPKACPEIFPYNGDSVSKAWADACLFTGVVDLRVHDLRHDGISRLFEMNWDIPRVASVSGHRSWNSLRHYTHLRGQGDPYRDWAWLQRVIDAPVKLGKRLDRKGA